MLKVGFFLAVTLLAMPAAAQQPGLRAEQERGARALVNAATQAIDFDERLMGLDVYRALKGAGLELSTSETIAMAREAFSRGFPAEAEAALVALFPAGEPRDAEAAGFESMAENIRRAAAQDRNGGLEDTVASAEYQYSAQLWITTAEAFAGADDHVRAVEYYLRGLILHDPTASELEAIATRASQEHRRAVDFYRLALGPDRHVMTPPQLARVRLNLGISLFKLGRVQEARTTWASIEGNLAVETLAQVWIGVADRAAK